MVGSAARWGVRFDLPIPTHRQPTRVYPDEDEHDVVLACFLRVQSMRKALGTGVVRM
jgi:hypothetical protein